MATLKKARARVTSSRPGRRRRRPPRPRCRGRWRSPRTGARCASSAAAPVVGEAMTEPQAPHAGSRSRAMRPAPSTPVGGCRCRRARNGRRRGGQRADWRRRRRPGPRPLERGVDEHRRRLSAVPATPHRRRPSYTISPRAVVIRDGSGAPVRSGPPGTAAASTRRGPGSRTRVSAALCSSPRPSGQARFSPVDAQPHVATPSSSLAVNTIWATARRSCGAAELEDLRRHVDVQRAGDRAGTAS